MRAMRFGPFAVLLLLAIWIGTGTAIILIGAPAAFANSPDRSTAANIVGAMLHRWHYLALLIPAVLLIVEWRSGLHQTSRVMLLVAALLLATGQIAIDAKVHAMRQNSLTPISELAEDDPYRRRFGMLHGISSMIMLVHVVIGACVMWSLVERPGERNPASSSTERSIDL